jgi:hypothetical protein
MADVDLVNEESDSLRKPNPSPGDDPWFCSGILSASWYGHDRAIIRVPTLKVLGASKRPNPLSNNCTDPKSSMWQPMGFPPHLT